ncbi:acyl-CoA thioester hydrolase/BAAT C-terminal domain-containing protein [Rhodanobacter sp. AS-Z3]|uniref:acyl-CoA thioester hydrolase/BAAT C-terminal domain-containing protein n=1 Tax=Rhodanobacter sp. AS-Z3 TaxID=3031330 RepID=UPI00247B0F96|nr:acyl-CoA thioester hydrolase/BAAT C-terminal domain-containing protein [Rhodanobacter sp. AS-Z3]WEN15204.1 acyl-CoA thioester hydrolase/BAAT C-terminal domain-containing protein [Rhodanobacter sp. AS-Z3]
MAISVVAIIVGVVGYGWYQAKTFDTTTLPTNYGKVVSKLYLGEGERQPLLAGFGGAEGGNAWASRHWQGERDTFVKQGYAFLAPGYFGMPGTPERLDRLSLDAVHDAILVAAKNPQVEGRCIALIGGSRGAELALTVASRYPDIKAVMAIVPGSAVFAGNTPSMKTSAFTWHGKPLPYVPVPWAAVPDLLKHHLREAFEKMLTNQPTNQPAVEAAAIPVERINGPVYLMSATHDELWPSQPMAAAMMRRLDTHQFAFTHTHDVFDGGHAAPLAHFDRVHAFLASNFLAQSAQGCPRSTAL